MPKPEDAVQWIIKKLFPRTGRMSRRAMSAWKFATADAVVVSFPKSGRTWLRAMLTYYWAERFGLTDPPLLEFANLHYLDRRIPKIYFTHDDDANARPQDLRRDKSRYRNKRVLFVARDPRDVCVSLYFHRRNRDHDLDQAIFPFAAGEQGGLRTTLEFMNIWGEALRAIPNSLCIRYESMHAAPEETLGAVLRFLGEEPDPRALAVAFERSRFDRMQSLERAGSFESGRLTAGDAGDVDSYKVRRGKVGGFADYFDPDECKALDEIVAAHLSPAGSALVGTSI